METKLNKKNVIANARDYLEFANRCADDSAMYSCIEQSILNNDLETPIGEDEDTARMYLLDAVRHLREAQEQLECVACCLGKAVRNHDKEGKANGND